jgi:hypothetical protein
MNADRLWKILDAIQAQIRSFDTKAQIALGINGILAGFFGANTGKLGESWIHASSTYSARLLIALAILTLLLMSISVMFAVFTIHPRLHLKQPNSHIFFAHISNVFGNDYEQLRKTFNCITESEHIADLENQILAVSIICSKKAQLFKYALFTMAVGLWLWVATLGIQFRVAQRIDTAGRDSSITNIINQR